MDSNEWRSELETKIAAGFAARSYPGDNDLVEADSLGDGDARDLLDAVKGRSWQQAAPFILTSRLADSIWFFTSEGYLYYLPAYLTGLLHRENYDRIGEAIISSLERFLVLDYSTPYERYNGLTGDECRIVAAVLNFVNRRLPEMTQDALDAYWGKYL